MTISCPDPRSKTQEADQLENAARTRKAQATKHRLRESKLRHSQKESLHGPAADRLLASISEPVLGPSVQDKLMNLYPEVFREADGAVSQFK
jgi:hypothetical protein